LSVENRGFHIRAILWTRAAAFGTVEKRWAAAHKRILAYRWSFHCAVQQEWTRSVSMQFEILPKRPPQIDLLQKVTLGRRQVHGWMEESKLKN
jgi:hypothetical protein